MALKIDSAETFDSKEFMDTIWAAITKLYGEYGASKTGLTMINYEVGQRIVTIRAANAAVDMIRAALASTTKVDDVPVALHVLAVSGTLKALNKRISL